MSRHNFQTYFYDRATDKETNYTDMYDATLDEAIFDAEYVAGDNEYFDIYIEGEESYIYSNHYEF